MNASFGLQLYEHICDEQECTDIGCSNPEVPATVLLKPEEYEIVDEAAPARAGQATERWARSRAARSAASPLACMCRRSRIAASACHTPQGPPGR